MTWSIGLLLPADARTIDDVDCSLDDVGGVLIVEPGPRVDSLLTAATRGISPISIRSSSSSLPVRVPVGLGWVPASVVCNHFPSGSMVTWSTDLGVDLSISLTYLSR